MLFFAPLALVDTMFLRLRLAVCPKSGNMMGIFDEVKSLPGYASRGQQHSECLLGNLYYAADCSLRDAGHEGRTTNMGPQSSPNQIVEAASIC